MYPNKRIMTLFAFGMWSLGASGVAFATSMRVPVKVLCDRKPLEHATVIGADGDRPYEESDTNRDGKTVVVCNSPCEIQVWENLDGLRHYTITSTSGRPQPELTFSLKSTKGHPCKL